jgi:hypothetical protein
MQGSVFVFVQWVRAGASRRPRAAGGLGGGDPLGMASVGAVNPFPFWFRAGHCGSAAVGRGDVGSEGAEHGLHLKDRQAVMFAQQPCDQAGDVRRGNTVARHRDRAAILSGDEQVDACRAELDWRRGVVEDPLRVLSLMRCHRNHRRVEGGVARTGALLTAQTRGMCRK